MNVMLIIGFILLYYLLIFILLTKIDEAHCLNSAMRGLGTDEKVLIQLICTKESHEIQQLSETYKKSTISFIIFSFR
jgi:hypothetical protein